MALYNTPTVIYGQLCIVKCEVLELFGILVCGTLDLELCTSK